MSKILNPATNRYVNRHGRIGRQILQHETKKQDGNHTLNLPPDIMHEIRDFLPYNCGTFIRQHNVNEMDGQTKKRLKKIVIDSLEEFHKRVAKSHYIKRCSMIGYTSHMLGERIKIHIKQAKDPDMTVRQIVDCCQHIAKMKKEAVAIVNSIREYLTNIQTFLKTGTLPTQTYAWNEEVMYEWFSDDLYTKHTKVLHLDPHIHLRSRDHLLRMKTKLVKNLKKDEQTLKSILQNIHVKKIVW